MSTEKLYSAIFSEDDIKWQSIIYELIRSKKVDPWDIDLSKFSNEYLSTIRKLKELNFRVSGKVVLAAALMLKLKTNHLGLNDFILMTNEEDEYDGFDELDENEYMDPDEQKIIKLARHMKHNTKKKYLIEPKTVLPRKRKVTVLELMGALKKAIDVDKRRDRKRAKIDRRILEAEPEEIFNVKKDLINQKIKELHRHILKQFSEKKTNILFSSLLDKGDSKDKIEKFLPALHLANNGKISILQEKPFEDIYLEVHE